jgi:hypothetical protein
VAVVERNIQCGRGAIVVEITQNFLDFSMYSTWMKCPWQWYERYVNRRVPRDNGYQKDDALTLGSLVHSGLEHWYKDRTPTIDAQTIEECGPTPECLQLARTLLEDYVRQYPSEPWQLESVEEPILTPLTDDVLLMAKVDAYFKVDSMMELVSNSEGHTISVTPGYWVQEYKTKGEGVSRANWMMGWEVNRQASFQTLALEAKLGVEVQGVIVNVIEKPRAYTPKRKCKGCGQMLELAAFTPVGLEYMCPLCGNVQKVKPYEPKTERTSDFFRVKVQRSREQLITHREEFELVANDMQMMRAHGMDQYAPNSLSCVDTRFGACSYFRNHTYNVSTLDDPLMVERNTTKYTGLVVI